MCLTLLWKNVCTFQPFCCPTLPPVCRWHPNAIEHPSAGRDSKTNTTLTMFAFFMRDLVLHACDLRYYRPALAARHFRLLTIQDLRFSELIRNAGENFLRIATSPGPNKTLKSINRSIGHGLTSKKNCPISACPPHCPVNQLGIAVCCSKTARACCTRPQGIIPRSPMANQPGQPKFGCLRHHKKFRSLGTVWVLKVTYHLLEWFMWTNEWGCHPLEPAWSLDPLDRPVRVLEVSKPGDSCTRRVAKPTDNCPYHPVAFGRIIQYYCITLDVPRVL